MIADRQCGWFPLVIDISRGGDEAHLGGAVKVGAGDLALVIDAAGYAAKISRQKTEVDRRRRTPKPQRKAELRPDSRMPPRLAVIACAKCFRFS